MVLAAALVGTFTSCDDFLDYKPTAVVDEDKAFSEPDKMVNSAYAMLGDCWYSYPFNLWPYGDLSSDDCLKGGGGTGDTGYHDVEIWSTLTSTRANSTSYGIVSIVLFPVATVPWFLYSRMVRAHWVLS